MPYSPDSVVQLYRVPWDNSYRHMRYFASGTERDKWHTSKVDVERNRLTTVKLGEPIKINAQYNDVQSFNYMRFRNPHDNTRWYYCFLVEANWCAQDTTELVYEVDWYQTWLDEIKWGKAFIERTHTDGDRVTQLSEPISAPSRKYLYGGSLMYGTGDPVYLAVCSTLIINNRAVTDDVSDYICSSDGVAEGVYICATTNMRHLLSAVSHMETISKGTINFIYAIPRDMVTLEYYTASPVDDGGTTQWVKGITVKRKSTTMTKPIAIGSYVPKNNKTLMYPNVCVLAHNFAGEVRQYKYEDTSDGNITFVTTGRVGSTVGISLVATNYEGDGSQLSEIHLPDAPKIGWHGDTMSQYYASNSVALDSRWLKPVAAIGGAIASAGNPAMVAGAISSTVDTSVQTSDELNRVEHSGNPAQVPASSMLANLSRGQYNFGLYFMRCTVDEAKAVDNFYTMYGYNVSTFTSVNPAKRPSFTFIKTQNANISGAVPVKCKQVLNGALNNGCTFWRKDDIGNYDLTNK